ncbi:hypothetical protein ACQ4WX_08405 [Streptomyces lasalocidi]
MARVAGARPQADDRVGEPVGRTRPGDAWGRGALGERAFLLGTGVQDQLPDHPAAFGTDLGRQLPAARHRRTGRTDAARLP